jgi:adenylate cyclase
MTNKSVVSLLIACVIFILTAATFFLGYFEKPEFFVYDSKAKLFRTEKVPPKNIKLILVDDASLKALEGVAGRWPWPRAIWADLLEFLSMGGARAVLFDIMFTERSSQQDSSNDTALADATLASGNVYHSMVISKWAADDDRKANAELGQAMPEDFVQKFSIKNLSGSLNTDNTERRSRNNDFALPIDPLLAASKGVAVVEFSPDSDGVLRRTQPLREYRGKYFPVLGIAPFIDTNTSVVVQKDVLIINDRKIPIDRDGNCTINMYGIDKVSAYSIGGVFASLQKIRKGDVEDLLVNPEEFKDAIVFVGASAVGTKDLKPTPLSSSAPGVIFHVSLASNYLLNDFLLPADRKLTILSIFIGACLTPWTIFYSKRFSLRILFPLVLLIVYVSYSFLAFKSNRLVDAIPFIFSTVTSSFLSFGYLTFTEAAEKRRVSHLFTQYVSKDVLHEVLHNFKEYQKAAAGSRVELTVLFSDIRGFTTMSETTPPEKIVEMLNVHFSVMADIILRHNGTIDKYIGDAIMAFWGAPVKTADHPEQAVVAGREMLEALKEVNATLRERGFEHEIKIGVGINTGIATLGEIGSEKKKNYTIVGDTVNLASRLESITKEYKSPLIFSEYTYEKVKSKLDCKLLGNVKVKGREQPVDIYTLA